MLWTLWQNSVDDNVRAATSCCERLLQSLNVKNPFNSMVIEAMKSQIARFKDGGFLTGILTLNLALLWQESEVPSILAPLAFDMISDKILSYNKQLSKFVDPTSLTDLMVIVKTALTSHIFLNTQEISAVEYLASLILRLYVSSIKEAEIKAPDVSFCHIPSYDLYQCKIEPGLLIPAPIDCSDFSKLSFCKVALFDISLSGDSEETFQVEMDSSVSEETFLHNAKKLLDKMVDNCLVNLVACQRVIHPQLKAHLRIKGCAFLDRLSAETVPSFCDLTGARPISSLNDYNIEDRLGSLKAIDRITLDNDKNFLQLQGSDGSCQTFMICSPTEEIFRDLRSKIESCLHLLICGLKLPASLPCFVAGGGCHLAALHNRLAHDLGEMAEDLRVQARLKTTAVTKRVFEVFLDALKQTAAALLTNEHLTSFLCNEHHWMVDDSCLGDSNPVSCTCGAQNGLWSATEQTITLTENYDLKCCLLDSLDSFYHALQMSFQVSSILIQTDRVICSS